MSEQDFNDLIKTLNKVERFIKKQSFTGSQKDRLEEQASMIYYAVMNSRARRGGA